MSLPPARVASPIAEVETPALLIDLDAYERNLDRMAESLEGQPVRLRAHAKTHKCPIIATHQISRGAVGICCQTLGEAEAMVLGGVHNILITNQIVSTGKVRRLAALAKQAEVMVCADDEANLQDLDAAAALFGVQLPVLVEVNIGQNRCGVEPGRRRWRWRGPSRPDGTSALPASRLITGRPSISTNPGRGPRSSTRRWPWCGRPST